MQSMRDDAVEDAPRRRALCVSCTVNSRPTCTCGAVVALMSRRADRFVAAGAEATGLPVVVIPIRLPSTFYERGHRRHGVHRAGRGRKRRALRWLRSLGFTRRCQVSPLPIAGKGDEHDHGELGGITERPAA